MVFSPQIRPKINPFIHGKEDTPPDKDMYNKIEYEFDLGKNNSDCFIIAFHKYVDNPQGKEGLSFYMT